MRPIDADELMKAVEREEMAATNHGQEFCSSFLSSGGEISTEWWCVEEMIENAPTIYGQWNNHEVACIIADLMGDTCACNFNGNDEWLPGVCEFAETCCPNPVGVACWEQYLKWRKKDGEV